MYGNIQLCSSTEVYRDSNFLINLIFVSFNACRIATHIYKYMFYMLYICSMYVEETFYNTLWNEDYSKGMGYLTI